MLVEGDRKVPKTNYTDPGISFPRLQAKIFTIDGNTYSVTVWLWEEAGGNRRQVRDGPAGSFRNAAINGSELTHGSVATDLRWSRGVRFTPENDQIAAPQRRGASVICYQSAEVWCR